MNWMTRWLRRNDPPPPESHAAIVALQDPPMVRERPAEPRPVEPSGEICAHEFGVEFYKPCPMPHDDKERRRSELFYLYAAHAMETVEAKRNDYQTRDYYWTARNGPSPWKSWKDEKEMDREWGRRYSDFNLSLSLLDSQQRLWCRWMDLASREARNERIADLSADAVIRKLKEQGLVRVDT